LTRLVGTAKERELYFLGGIIDAETAHSLGWLGIPGRPN
jgi:1,4-dihydroxy-2-naphthoyl-CoA synthase